MSERNALREERIASFWALTIPEPNTGCWLWLGTEGPRGYGRLSFCGRRQRANRCAWEITRGPIADGLFVCHRCDQPSCVNPDHLFLGTHQDNMSDMARKGRGRGCNPNPRRGDAHHARARPEVVARGERSGSAKVTSAMVLALRARRAQGQTFLRIATEMGLPMNLVRCAAIGRTWAHLPNAQPAWRPKLTPELVLKMRRRVAAGESVLHVAKTEGIDKDTARQAIKRITWKHVSEDVP